MFDKFLADTVYSKGIIIQDSSHVLELIEKINDRFKNRRNPVRNLKALSYDICEFYPNTNVEKVKRALKVLDDYFPLEKSFDKDQFLSILAAERRCEYVNNGQNVWATKNLSTAMGSKDSVVTDIVGFAITYELVVEGVLCKDSSVLYRDDGGCFKQMSGPEVAAWKKKIEAKFKSWGFKMEFSISPTLNILDLKISTNEQGLYQYSIYRKPSSKIDYIHIQSDHRRSWLDFTEIAQRVRDRCSNVDSFNQSKNEYIEALTNAGHNETHVKSVFNNVKKRVIKNKGFQKKPDKSKDTKRIFFTPYFSSRNKEAPGFIFRKTCQEILPPEMAKIISKRVRTAPKRTSNISEIIQRITDSKVKKYWENLRLAKAKEKDIKKSCNCRKPEYCPLDGVCVGIAGVYQAVIPSENGNKFYIGSSANVKTRIQSHRGDVRNGRTGSSQLANACENEEIGEQEISWSILKTFDRANIGGPRCQLCIEEAIFILKNVDNENCLNTRQEVLCKCRHKATLDGFSWKEVLAKTESL